MFKCSISLTTINLIKNRHKSYDYDLSYGSLIRCALHNSTTHNKWKLQRILLHMKWSLHTQNVTIPLTSKVTDISVSGFIRLNLGVTWHR